jgi:hypothetical protein
MLRAIIVDPKTKTMTYSTKEWTLKELQEEVGGNIENVSIDPEITIYADEEGRLKELNEGFYIKDTTADVILGKAVILGGLDRNGDDTTMWMSKGYFEFRTTYYQGAELDRIPE